jgi:lipopolysaccharide assembly outer membrane protein LptD (OstA)
MIRQFLQSDTFRRSGRRLLVFLKAQTLVWLAAGSATAQSTSQSPDILPPSLGQQIFLDSKTTSFTRDGRRQIFEGDVVAIAGGALISADKVELNQKEGTLSAEGHVVIMSNEQVFTGETIIYHLNTGDFKLTDAVMTVGDKNAVQEVSRTLLGFSKAEVEFEAQRRQRLGEISARKNNLRLESHRQVREADTVSPDIVEKYATLIEQEDLIKQQENPILARLGTERRESFERRRKYWDSSRKSALASVASKMKSVGYFKIEGRVIQRTSGNDFLARQSLWTPCRCEDDEAPAWGFRSDRTEAQIGGYADLYHPVLEIKGIPVLYLPYLKLPLKSQRQSGFLPPIFGFESRSGNIFSQPVFFDFNEAEDATLKTDIFQNRGTRLGIEYRLQQREYSGWELRLEGIRDRDFR